MATVCTTAVGEELVKAFSFSVLCSLEAQWLMGSIGWIWVSVLEVVAHGEMGKKIFVWSW